MKWLISFQTGLLSLADTVVGGSVGSGLSGGQKRRLCVALQMINLPSVLFLDEPTSGSLILKGQKTKFSYRNPKYSNVMDKCVDGSKIARSMIVRMTDPDWAWGLTPNPLPSPRPFNEDIRTQICLETP